MQNQLNPQNKMTQELPEYHSHEEFQLRTQKLADIRELGIDPYPHKFTPANTTKELHEIYGASSIGHSENAAEGTTPPVTVAGRLVLFRSMGKNAFAQIQDSTGRIQVMFNKETTKVAGYDPSEHSQTDALSHMKFIEKKIDLGDIIGIQ